MQASKKIYELLIEKLQGLGWKIQAMSSYSSVLKSGAEMSSEMRFRLTAAWKLVTGFGRSQRIGG